MAIETLPIEALPAFEGIGKFIGIVGTFMGGIVGIYLIAFITRWVYSARMLGVLKDIREELETLNGKKKNEGKNKQRSSRKVS